MRSPVKILLTALAVGAVGSTAATVFGWNGVGYDGRYPTYVRPGVASVTVVESPQFVARPPGISPQGQAFSPEGQQFVPQGPQFNPNGDGREIQGPSENFQPQFGGL